MKMTQITSSTQSIEKYEPFIEKIQNHFNYWPLGSILNSSQRHNLKCSWENLANTVFQLKRKIN